MDSLAIWKKWDSWLLLAIALLLSISSIFNLGYFSVLGFFILSVLILRRGPQMGFIYIIMMYYLPTLGTNVPRAFLVSSLLVLVFDFKYIFSAQGVRRIRTVVMLFVAFAVLMAFSFLYVSNMELYTYYLTFLLYLFIHLFICNNLLRNENDVDFCLKWWGVIGVLAAIIGFVHFSLQGQVYLTTLVNPDSLAGKVNLSNWEGDIWKRWITAGSEPNYVGLNLLIPLGINIYFLTKKIGIYNFILVLITYFGVFGTFSRSSFLASLVLVLMFILFSKSSKKLFIVPGGIAVVFAVINLFPEFIERIDTISENLEERGGTYRFDLWIDAINLWWSNPLFGVGLGQVQLYTSYRTVIHNTYLNILAEGGIIVFSLFISIMVLYLKEAYSLYRRQGICLFIATGIGYTVNLNTVSEFDYRLLLSLIILLYAKTYFTETKENELKSVALIK